MYTHVKVFRAALNKIHLSETHSEREFGHMLHIVNKKRSCLGSVLVEAMMRIFFNDRENKVRHEHENFQSVLDGDGVYMQASRSWCDVVIGQKNATKEITHEDFLVLLKMQRVSNTLEKLKTKGDSCTINGVVWKIKGRDFRPKEMWIDFVRGDEVYKLSAFSNRGFELLSQWTFP